VTALAHAGLNLTTLARPLASDRARRRGTGSRGAALSEPSARDLHRTGRWLERSRIAITTSLRP
jgi:hypothetical protein